MEMSTGYVWQERGKTHKIDKQPYSDGGLWF